MNIYIACGLTHVPRQHFSSYTKFIHQLAADLKGAEPNFRDIKYALQDSDPKLAERSPGEQARLCYIWDRKMVEDADLVVAEASFPSIGLGIEIQLAENKDTPIILCFRDYEGNKAEPISYETMDHKHHDLQIGEGYITLMALGVPSVYQVIQYDDCESGLKQIGTAVDILSRI